jgi:trans-aconitate 2-methyltransferase
MAAATRDWDAATYERVSEIQERWARGVLDRLVLEGDETVLDAGCGSGRVTAMLLDRLPRGSVIGVDAAPSMIREAEQALGGRRARFFVSDLLDLQLEEEVDAVFSNAVFHWVPDHPRLFRQLFKALRPGGRLVAQCGGEGNVEAFLREVDRVIAREPFRQHFATWERPWHFPAPSETEIALREAGFAEIRCSLDPKRETPEWPEEFLRVVCLGAHLDRLPAELHDDLCRSVREELGDPLAIDYVRLNIDARRPS